MSRACRLLALVALLYVTVAMAVACGRTSEEAKPAEAKSLLPASAQTAPVRALMAAIVDPSADVVWGSVATIMFSSTQIEERAPKNDQEWAEVRRNALMMKEAGDLLLTPNRPIAGPGEKSVVPGVELEPEDIFANVQKRQDEWKQVVQEFHGSLDKVLKAIDAKDPKQLFDTGEDLDAACEKCHITFWYPNERLPPGYEETAPKSN